MGIFDKLKGQEETLTPQAGLLLSAITVIGADGEVDDDELAVVRRLDGSDSTSDWEAAVRAYGSLSVDDCVRAAAAALDGPQRLTAMANLVDIAMADGGLAGDEKAVLEAFVAEFDVDETTLEKIVDVIGLKNDRSRFT